MSLRGWGWPWCSRTTSSFSRDSGTDSPPFPHQQHHLHPHMHQHMNHRRNCKSRTIFTGSGSRTRSKTNSKEDITTTNTHRIFTTTKNNKSNYTNSNNATTTTNNNTADARRIQRPQTDCGTTCCSSVCTGNGTEATSYHSSGSCFRQPSVFNYLPSRIPRHSTASNNATKCFRSNSNMSSCCQSVVNRNCHNDTDDCGRDGALSYVASEYDDDSATSNCSRTAACCGNSS